MPNIIIKTTTMGFRVSVSRAGVITGTVVSIVPFVKRFEHHQFNPGNKTWVLLNEYFYFDKDQEICYFPKYELDSFLDYMKRENVNCVLESLPTVPGAPAEFMMLPHVTYKNDKQKKAVEFLIDEKSGPLRGLGLQTGVGKLQRLDSLIKTPTGWVRMGDIQLGQLVSTPDGHSAPVTGIFPQGSVPIYRIYFEDGRWTDCGGEHLWKIHYVQWKDRWRVITTEQIIHYMNNNPTYARRMYVPLIEPEIKDDVDLSIDPYILGAILGDGTITAKAAVPVCKPDEWLRQEIDKYLPKGMNCTEFGKDAKTFYIRGREEVSNKRMIDLIEDLGLFKTYSHTKFIPDMYMDASPKQRLHLLQGLLDTDGTVGVSVGRGNTDKIIGKGGSVQYCTTSERMANQVQELVRSLGGLCRIGHKNPFYYDKDRNKIPGKKAYILGIRMKDPKSLFRMPRKKERCSDDYQYADSLKLRIKAIEPAGVHPAQCIMVDHPDHLYITDDYIVTHNTVSLIMSIQKLGVRSMVTMTSRLEQWVSEITKYTTLDEDDVYVIQGVGSLTKLFSQIDKGISPKIILVSTKTLRLYMDYGPTYQHLPHPTTMCEELKIGLVAQDETHEHFYSNLLMGLLLNPAIFIPITATFLVSNQFVRGIFDKFFPKEIQFNGGEYEKFVNITSYRYEGATYQIKPFFYTSPQGYSQTKLEKYLTDKKGLRVLDPLIKDAIIPIVQEHYIDIAEEGEKFLFLCATTDMCDYMEHVFKRYFPKKKVTSFHSGRPAHLLEKNDMIVSTPGSAGTGRDVKGLRTCFVFDNTGSEVRNLQYLGRLRGPPQMLNTPEFCYLYFAGIPQHVKYSQARALLYASKAKSIKHRTIR